MARSRITGHVDTERALKELGPKVAKKVVNNSLRAGARVIRDGAKLRAPKRTGQLAAAITVATVKGKVQVGFKPPVSRRAHLTEFGTKKAPAKPFVRPTIEQDGPKAIDKIGKVMGKGIEREAKKRGGR